MSPLFSLRIFGFQLFLASLALAQIPAFPGAEGYGAFAKGGRGGDVYHVTNLNTSGTGSFADAIATVPTAGRTIVFDVSGHIHVNKTTLSKSNVTIAGQTAPGDGIGFKDGTFIISGDDIVIRHARFRYGKKAAGGDCIDLSSGTLNAILDQVSLAYSTDENISSFNSPPENLTMQWALNGWGLESHSCGGLWDQNHASAHHSLWAHNHTRNPKARPNGLLEWINNVTFDWDIGFIMGDSNSNASWKANVRGCYFLCPPGNLRTKALEKAGLQTSNGLPNFSLYLDNCLHDADGDGLLNGTNKGYGIASGSYNISATPFAGSAAGIAIDPPLVAFKKIVSKAGALRLDVSYAGPLRDEVDAKMVANLVTQTRQHISTETTLGLTNGGFGTLNSTVAPLDSEKDGMPDFYETALGWNVAAQDHNTELGSSGGFITGLTFFPTGTVAGYTRLEEYLHFLAIPHGTVAKNTSIAVNMAKFTSGFSVSPTFAVSNISNGTLVVAGNVATFTPTLNFTGRARFDFTVTDAAGSAWTQTCALVVTSSTSAIPIVWAGDGVSNIWDNGALNWRLNGAPVASSGGETKVFDDTGSNTPNPTLTNGTAGGHIVVDAVKNYTFAGGAAFILSPLTKRGTGTLTITATGTSNITPVTLDAGTLAVPGPGLGLGAPALVTFNGGTFSTGLDISPTNVVVNNTVTIVPTGTRAFGGAWTGAGTANLAIGNNTFSLTGNTSAFAGTFALGTSTGFLRFNGASGSASATFDLGTSTADLINRNGNATFDLGALAGGSGTFLGGASSVNAPSTYNIGGNGDDSTFAGTIGNGGAGGVTNLVKVGSGALTLTGASTYTGTTAVNAGELIVNGSLGATATTVATGAKLRGAGSIAGNVTMQAGSQLSPGASSGTVGTLSFGAGLTLSGATLSMQVSGNPAGANDKVAMSGGALTFSSVSNLTLQLTDGVLGAGVYELISGGASTVGGVGNIAFGPLTSGRQTFAFTTPPGKLVLTVTGAPATLRWLGTSAAWDSSAANFANVTSGANPDIFQTADAVIFDDTAATGAVTLVDTVYARSVTITNTTRAYSFTGESIFTTGALTKKGAGSLTFTDANSFAGGVVLNAGTIVLGNDVANADGLTGGPVTLNGGVISMHDDSASYNDFNAALVVPIGATARINADSRVDVYGSLAGAGTLDFYVPFVRTTLFADWSAFTGTINVLSDASGGDFRIGTSYSPAGYGNATIYLSANTSLYFTGTLSQGMGTTIEIGELSGPSNSTLLGGATGGRALTYRIGGKTQVGGYAIFLGNMAEQNTGTLTNYVKTGAGKWTIHNGAWNGGTEVEQGTLEITGLITCASATNVSVGATLWLDEGDLATDALNIATGASLVSTGGSNVIGDLNNDGSIHIGGDELHVSGDFINNGTMQALGGGQFFGAGDVVNNGTIRFASSGVLTTTGTFTNNGLLDLLTSTNGLPPNFINNGTVILNTDRRILSVAKAGANFSCTVFGYTAHSYQLERADTLAGPWTPIGGMVAGAGATITFTDTGGATGTAGFFRVSVTP